MYPVVSSEHSCVGAQSYRRTAAIELRRYVASKSTAFAPTGLAAAFGLRVALHLATGVTMYPHVPPTRECDVVRTRAFVRGRLLYFCECPLCDFCFERLSLARVVFGPLGSCLPS